MQLIDLPAEKDTDTGYRRPGSQEMDSKGLVALRREYVATSLGCAIEAVKEAEEGLREKGFLDLVQRSSFGRPTRYQALVSKGGETPHLSRGETHGVAPGKTPPLVPPIKQTSRTTTKGETPPPTYRTPDDGDHLRTPREEPPPVPTKKSAAKEEHATASVASPVAAAFGRPTICRSCHTAPEDNTGLGRTGLCVPCEIAKSKEAS